MPEQTVHNQSPDPTHQSLKRDLEGRHVQLISIGGCIGTGLFMGSGKTIATSGPSVIMVYAVIGFMLFFVMRAMGELLLSDLKYKSFVDCTEELLGPWAGFATGWSYWFAWIVTAIAELIAIAGYFSFWWPDLPTWIPALVAVIILVGINLLAVRAFGEIEFWFALIKILAILMLIGVGCYLVATEFISPEGYRASMSNLWTQGGFFPTGWVGVMAGFQTAVFAFVGMEIVGTTAAEVRNPVEVMPRAINTIPLRILMFYIGTLVVLMMVTPWPFISPTHSPFVGMFALIGLSAAASVVNFVVITSAMSSTNSGIYSTSRMLYGLSWHEDAARLFGQLSARGVPVYGLMFAGFLLLFAAVLLVVKGSIMDAFQLVGAVSSLLFIFIWTMILMSYMVYRRRRPAAHARSVFKMPWGLWMSVIVLVFFAFFIGTLTLDDNSRTALLVLPVWFVLLMVIYLVKVRNQPRHLSRREQFTARAKQELAEARAFKLAQKAAGQ